MSTLKKSTEIILEELVKRNPDSTEFKTQQITSTADELGYKKSDYLPLIDGEFRSRIGWYNLAHLVEPIRKSNVLNMPKTAAAMAPQSIVNKDKTFAKVDPTFVPWGSYTDIIKVIKSEMFYPVYISGLSGNGKTFMVEQAAANLNR